MFQKKKGTTKEKYDKEIGTQGMHKEKTTFLELFSFSCVL